MLRFEKLTVKAQEALQDANEVAARHENQEITPLHLLAALSTRRKALFRRCSRVWAFARKPSTLRSSAKSADCRAYTVFPNNAWAAH